MLARDGALCDDITVRDATDLLWTMMSVESWVHLRETCGWTQAGYLAGMRRMVRSVIAP